MQFHIAVVDDMDSDREQMRLRILNFFDDRPADSVQISCYNSAEDFLREFAPGMFQIIFFDICMGGISGTEAAKRIRREDRHCLIVFSTTTEEYVFETFSSHPFDYIRKPCSVERFFAVLSEAAAVLGMSVPEITVRVPHGELNIPAENIISVTADGHLLDIHLANGDTVESNMKFSELEALVTDFPQFLTVNRGIMVNMDYTVSLADGLAHLQDGSFYPVRVRERTQLSTVFSQYMISRMREDKL